MAAAAISFRRVASRNPLATIGVVLVVTFIIFAVFAPWIAPQNPAFIDLPNRLARPSFAHGCGTDELGRDILSRLIYGARISMLVGSSVVLGSLFLGLIIGSIAGYYGGRVDRFVNVLVMNAFLSWPSAGREFSTSYWRFVSEVGSDTRHWYAPRCWRRAIANMSRRPALWEPATCA